MGILQRLFGLGSGAVTCVIDVPGLESGNGRRANLSPGDQLGILRRLARFAEREEMACVAGFNGEPLRKVGDGEDFDGVRVHFSGSDDAFNPMMLKLYKKERGRGTVVVVTGDRALEDDVQTAGGVTLRPSTFKKAVSEEGGGGESQDRNRRRRRPGRPQRGRRPNRRGEQRGGREKKSENGVHDYIDVVE